MKASTPTSERSQVRTRKRHRGNGDGDGDGERGRDALDRGVMLSALQAAADGDFSVRLPNHWTGLEGKIADHFNDIVASNQQMAKELSRVGEVVGKRGKTQQRARFARGSAAWGAMQVSVNTLIDDLVRPTTDV